MIVVFRVVTDCSRTLAMTRSPCSLRTRCASKEGHTGARPIASCIYCVYRRVEEPMEASQWKVFMPAAKTIAVAINGKMTNSSHSTRRPSTSPKP